MSGVAIGIDLGTGGARAALVDRTAAVLAAADAPIDPAHRRDARAWEGIARIEALGYRRLGELGGAGLRAVRTVGGGARNTAWTTIRARVLGIEMRPAASEQAAVGAARLALAAVTRLASR